MAAAPSLAFQMAGEVSPLSLFSAAEVESFKTLEDIATWAQVPVPVMDAFLFASGASMETMPRAIGVLPESDFAPLVTALMIKIPDGESPLEASTKERAINFIEKGKLTLFGHACRRCAFLGGSWMPLTVGAPSATGAFPPVAGVAARRVKLSQVLRQGDDADAPLISEAAMTTGYARLESIFGLHYRPPANADVTLDQLSAVQFLISSKDVPYLDFALWGPHGHRIARKMKLSGQVLDSNATFRYMEVAGPPNLEVWSESFQVMQTAFLMLEICELGTLTQYHKHITDLHTRFGPQCWMLLYQAETRFRNEQVDRCRRKAAQIHDLARTAGRGTTPFVEATPWNYSYQLGMDDGKWWEREFEQPAMMVLTRTQNLHSFVGGEAPIAGDRSLGESLPGVPGNRSNKRKLTPPPRPSPEQPPMKTTRTTDKSARRKNGSGGDMSEIVNGKYVKNRAGTSLCNSFQTGNCSDGQGGRCSRDSSLAHQCNGCLSRDHGGHVCTNSSAPKTRDGKGSKGGKGKGKKQRQW